MNYPAAFLLLHLAWPVPFERCKGVILIELRLGIGAGTLRPLAGVEDGDSGRVTGGVAALNHRLMAVIPAGMRPVTLSGTEYLSDG